MSNGYLNLDGLFAVSPYTYKWENKIPVADFPEDTFCKECVLCENCPKGFTNIHPAAKGCEEYRKHFVKRGLRALDPLLKSRTTDTGPR